MPGPFLKTASSFRSDERGAVAILFGLMFIVMLLLSGAAVDFGRVYATTSSVTAAADAAALAAGKGLLDGRLSEAEVEQMAVKYFDENLKSGGFAGTVDRPSITLDRETGSVTIAVNAHVPTTVLGITTIDEFRVPVKSVVSLEQKDIELSMALDVTGSMRGSKIADLRDAAKEAVQILLPEGGTPNKVRIALAPYDEGVNAGIYAAAATGGRSTKCTYEREGSNTNGLHKPSADNFLKAAGSPGVEARPSCPNAAKIVPLSNDRQALIDSIDDYMPGSSTAGHLGAQWAAYMLNPEWAGVFGGDSAAQFKDKKTVKAMILMTDGVFNTIGGVNYGDNSPQAIQSQDRARAICQALRDQEVKVFSIGFKMSENPAGARERAIQTLKDCTGNVAGRYIEAEDGQALTAAFSYIATQLTNLRLAQ